MLSIFKKYFRKCLLALVPLLLLSNAEFDSGTKAGIFHNSENFDYHSHYKTNFQTGTETTYDGTRFSVLKIHIEDVNVASEPAVEFIISRKKSLGEIGPGAYRIAKDKDGLLNHIDGVFGFLDSKNSGDLPFFAHFGEITIADLGEEAINGSMDIYFKNTIGDAIHINGNFKAVPQ